MSKEEAIKYLKKMKDECNDTFHKVRYVTQEEVLEMAIQALQAQADGEYIPKEAVLDIIDGWYEDKADIEDLIVRITYMHGVAILSAEPKWIPISERLPEEGVDVLACYYTGKGNYKMMVSRRSDYNYWSGVGRTGDMVAWMPLPTPYEPQESEVNNE